MIKITLPDGSLREMQSGVSALDIAKSISEGLARNVLAAKIDGVVVDAFLPITADASLELLTWDSPEGKATMWHSSAHLMAEALEILYPGIKLGIGPAIQTGFYYDVDFGDYTFTYDDFAALEQKMKELAKNKDTFVREKITRHLHWLILKRREMNISSI